MDGCPGLAIPRDPLDASSAWGCDRCGREESAADAAATVAALEEESEQLQKEQANDGGEEEHTRESMEALLAKMSRFLHPNHHAATDLKFCLVQMYGNRRAPAATLLQEGRRKQSLCQEVLAVMEKVTPGRFRLRGMFLFELYVVSLFLFKKEEEDPGSPPSPPSERMRRLEALRAHLEEAEEILSWEPAGSVEGRRRAVAVNYLGTLDNMLEQCRRAARKAGGGGGGECGGRGGGRKSKKKGK